MCCVYMARCVYMTHCVCGVCMWSVLCAVEAAEQNAVLPPDFLSGTDQADMKMMLISEHLGLSWAGESGIGAKEQGACPHLPLHRLPSEQQR